MWRYLIVCFLVCVNNKVFAQTNLVLNGNFDSVYQCTNPVYIGPLNWFSATLSSPDYYHINTQPGCPSGFGGGLAPQNINGYQMPHSGNGFGGIIPFIQNSDYKEYLESEFSDSLRAGKKYCVSFYLNLANASRYALQSISAVLSSDTLSQATANTITTTLMPISFNSGFIQDTLGWIQIRAAYTALGGERFITIGNFYSWNTTDTLVINSFAAPVSYYYIDDVFVGPSSDTITPPPPAEYPFAIYPNPTTGNAVFSYNFPAGGVLELYNSLGQIVYRKEYETGSAAVPLDLIILRSGLYYWRALEGNIKLAGDKLIIVR